MTCALLSAWMVEWEKPRCVELAAVRVLHNANLGTHSLFKSYLAAVWVSIRASQWILILFYHQYLSFCKAAEKCK